MIVQVKQSVPFVLLLFAAQALALNAALPRVADVPAAEVSPVDGVWRLNLNGARIRIEAGRAYALDPWQHLLLWTVQPEMVVMKSFRRMDAGRYTADDLPLAGRSSLRLTSARTLSAEVAGALGPVRFQLELVQADDPAALAGELQDATEPDAPAERTWPQTEPAPEEDIDAEAAYEPPSQPAPQGCTPIGRDPDTGMTICE